MKDFALSELQAVLRVATRACGVSAAHGEELAEAVAYAPKDFQDWDALRAMFTPPLVPGFPDATTRCLIDGPAVIDAALIAQEPIDLHGLDAPDVFSLYLRRAAHLFQCDWNFEQQADGRFRLARCDPSGPPDRPSIGRVFLDEALYAHLSELAARTHVPATQETRLSGAGAGLTDND